MSFGRGATRFVTKVYAPARWKVPLEWFALRRQEILQRMTAAPALAPAARVERPALGAGDVHGAGEELGDDGGAAQDPNHQHDLDQG